jgi:hypothetical protein
MLYLSHPWERARPGSAMGEMLGSVKDLCGKRKVQIVFDDSDDGFDEPENARAFDSWFFAKVDRDRSRHGEGRGLVDFTCRVLCHLLSYTLPLVYCTPVCIYFTSGLHQRVARSQGAPSPPSTSPRSATSEYPLTPSSPFYPSERGVKNVSVGPDLEGSEAREG